MAATLLLRGIPLLRRHRLIQQQCSGSSPAVGLLIWQNTHSPDYRQWKDKEDEILQDIEPIVTLAKEIIHSDKYVDGERLSDEDEKAVIEKLLAYHPHSEDKIGVGLHSIMVDRHPEFKRSRCLFVIRTDGAWIDFSYQKCVRAYIRDKYPSYAERFIRNHYKRGSS
ncbi:Dcl protein [Thalictrum thalictroides]|uniref:Dcl protein n=1 Tax=Thalictrum thalictroides TaxID=46969 RepID=A0A7J6VFS2_THATH|nr:Dcl protein [Thalictrum thalictroides]